MTEAEWIEARGWTVSKGHICVRRLALGRCGYSFLQSGKRAGCSHYGHVFDHQKMYVFDGAPVCIVGHEYPQGEEFFVQLRKYVRRWPQLSYEVRSPSWYSSSTFMVMLYHKEFWRASWGR